MRASSTQQCRTTAPLRDPVALAPSTAATDGPLVQEVVRTKGAIALCRCFASSKFPLCDGSHNKHNADNGDNAGPLVLKSLGGGAPVDVPKVDDSGLKVRSDAFDYQQYPRAVEWNTTCVVGVLKGKCPRVEVLHLPVGAKDG